MNPVTNSSIDEYRRLLNRCAAAMAVAQNAYVAEFLPAGDNTDLVDLFTDGNIDKRFAKLRDQLNLLEAEFGNLDDQIEMCIRIIPLDAYATGVSDADCFLEWLETRKQLTPGQIDLVVYQRARHQVEFLAARMRSRPIRFQDLCSVSDALRSDFAADNRIQIKINPIHCPATLRKTILFEDIGLPAAAIFFSVGIDVRMVVLERSGQWLVSCLAAAGPRNLKELARRFPGSAEDLMRGLKRSGRHRPGRFFAIVFP